jgi:hypothetical protein
MNNFKKLIARLNWRQVVVHCLAAWFFMYSFQTLSFLQYTSLIDAGGDITEHNFGIPDQWFDIVGTRNSDFFLGQNKSVYCQTQEFEFNNQVICLWDLDYSFFLYSHV